MTDALPIKDRSSEELATLIANSYQAKPETSKDEVRRLPLNQECREALDELYTRCNFRMRDSAREAFQEAWRKFLENPKSWLAYRDGQSRGKRLFKTWFRGVTKNCIRSEERKETLVGIKGFPAFATETCKPLSAKNRAKIHGLSEGMSLEDEIRFRMRNQPVQRQCDLVDDRVKLRRFEKPESVSTRTTASHWRKNQRIDELIEMWEFVDRECEPELRWAIKMRYRERRSMAATVARLAEIGFDIKPSTLQSRINRFIEKAKHHFQHREGPDALSTLLGLDADPQSRPEPEDGLRRLFRVDGAQKPRRPTISPKNTRNASQNRERR